MKRFKDFMGYGKDFEDVPWWDFVGLFLLVVLLATQAPK